MSKINKKISNKIKNINISGIRKIYDLAKDFKNPIKLNIGLPDFAVKKSVIEAANKAMNDGLNEYTPTAGIDELREKIAKNLNTRENLDYTKENVIITSAGTGALSVAIASLVDIDDEVIIMDPNFVIYEPLVLQNNGIPVIVPMTKDFHLDFEKIEEAITEKTKAILINTPNNPTGKVYTESELKKLAKIAEKNNIIIISDEVYKDFVYEDKKHISISRFYKDTFIVDSFSKTYSITG
jgi:aspartate/methionine/tyrosine aminotransferase